MANPDRAEQTPDRVAAEVRELIVAGEVRAGEFLRLAPLAQRFGTSVTPVREAMGRLRGEGFVRLEPRRGFVVLPLTDEDLGDVYRVHAYVAGELAALACRRLTDEQLDALRATQDELERAYEAGDADRVEELNYAFHRTINRAAGSPRLQWFLATAASYAPRLFFARIDGWAAASAHEHDTVLRALAARDPDAARRAMAAHVRSAGDLLARHRSRGDHS
ncbi:GntR family transcriptional regulator [Marmoricola endophyticus]|uniref:GntR family transcriptional regulator n=1 Tax=Marmoricola endophyticus TaxID=2040280 RepID=A0A917F354_9ACTN|nr:GntR family transcriptional regulator [Marmoricola endophyticus]GGF48179.1 GntR family transcriptional regulator [Marmoricola endophyticus]